MHVEDVGVDLAVLAGDTGDVGGQRVHKDGVLAVGGLLHELGRGAPILMRSVLGEQLLLERSDAGVVALGVQVGALLHGGKRSPALGDHDVGALEGLGHGVDLLKGGAGLGGVALSALDDLGHEVVALGVSQGDVHAKAGQQADQRLRAGQRLAVRGRIGPGDGNLLALEVLEAAKLVDEVEHVGRGLRGVIGVGLQGDKRGTVIQNAVLVSLLHGLGDLGHVGVALADVHVVAALKSGASVSSVDRTRYNILVLNGTNTNGLAGSFRSDLQEIGYANVTIDNGEATNKSIIICKDSELREILKSDTGISKTSKDASDYPEYDAIIILGEDYN